MSSAGGRLAVVAELGLWVTGAVLIASAAGMHVNVDLPKFPISTPKPADVVNVNPSPSGSAEPVLSPTPIATPTPMPTVSPLVAKFQAYLAKKDFQFNATGSGTQTATGTNLALDITLGGSVSYKSGDESDTTKMTTSGKTVAYDSVYSGSFAYERSNGGPWIKKARQPSDTANWRIFLSPTRLFVDTGVEKKNGSSLHRLEVADPAALGAQVNGVGTVSGADVRLQFWIKDDGTPMFMRMDGSWDQQISGIAAHVTTVQEFAMTRWAGISIAIPTNPWQWIVDGSARIAFGAPADWSKSDINTTIGWTTYGTTSATVGYTADDAGTYTLDKAADAAIAGYTDPPVGRKGTTVGGEPAVHFGVHRTKHHDYASETVVLHGGKFFQFVFFGSGTDAATDAMAAQILATLEFTK